MAILGFHIVLTLISASVLQKLSARYSFGRRLLTAGGLRRYLHPTNEQLRAATGHATNGAAHKNANTRRRGKKDEADAAEGFLVPKNVDVHLEQTAVNAIDVLRLPFYVQYRWLMDFALATMVVYVISEIFTYFTFGAFTSVRARVCSSHTHTVQEPNLSIVWLMVMMAVTLKCLASLSSLFFTESDDTGRDRVCVCANVAHVVQANDR
jgi:hypothetical protein